MLKFILVASIVVLFLIFSIPILIVENYIGKTNPEKKNRQSLSIVRFMFRFILKVAGIHITVKGIENIPEDGPVLYVGNHRSYFDILVGYTTVPTSLGFMAKKEMESIPLLSNWMRNVDCLFLDRENVKEGLKTILEGVDKVKSGVSIWIFPEGTRNRAENYLDLMPFKEGSLKIAEKAGCPVVPVAITGTAEAYETHHPKIRSSKVTIEFGEPFVIPGRVPRKAGAKSAQTENGVKSGQPEESVMTTGQTVSLPQAAAAQMAAGKALTAGQGEAATDPVCQKDGQISRNPESSEKNSGASSEAKKIKTLTAEEKKFAGAYARDVIINMLIKEKNLREGK